MGDEVIIFEGYDIVNFFVWLKSSSFLDIYYRRIVVSYGFINLVFVFYCKGVNI